jgi:hypothetical protein
MPNANEILGALQFRDAPEKEVHMAMPPVARKQDVVGAAYYFHVMSSPIDNGIIERRRQYAAELGDNYLPYQFDDIDDAVAACTELCLLLRLELTQAQRTAIRSDYRKNQPVYLIVYERPIFVMK